MSDVVQEGSALTRALQKMTDRERKLVAVGVAAVVVFALAGVAMGISSFIASREKRIRLHKDEIAQIETLRVAYDAATARETTTREQGRECKGCSVTNDADAAFCKGCGAKLTEATVAS